MTLAPDELDVVGTSITRPDGLSKTSGSARFADDLKLPRMAFCRLLRGTRPHARILSVDTSTAKALPGVFGVITGRDLAYKGARPLDNTDLSYAWRKRMARVYVERALARVCFR